MGIRAYRFHLATPNDLPKRDSADTSSRRRRSRTSTSTSFTTWIAVSLASIIFLLIPFTSLGQAIRLRTSDRRRSCRCRGRGCPSSCCLSTPSGKEGVHEQCIQVVKVLRGQGISPFGQSRYCRSASRRRRAAELLVGMGGKRMQCAGALQCSLVHAPAYINPTSFYSQNPCKIPLKWRNPALLRSSRKRPGGHSPSVSRFASLASSPLPSVS